MSTSSERVIERDEYCEYDEHFDVNPKNIKKIDSKNYDLMKICTQMKELSFNCKEYSQNLDCYRSKIRSGDITLNQIPKEYIDIDMIMFAIQVAPLNNIQYVEEQYLNFDICRNIVRKSVKNIEYIPEKYMTEEMADFIVNRYYSDNGIYTLQYLPQKFKTIKRCKIAVHNNPMNLEFVPEEIINFEMCKIALEKNVEALKYVPNKYINQELIYFTILQFKGLKYVPEEFKTYEVCDYALKLSVYNFIDVPENLKKHFLKSVLLSDSSMIKYANPADITYELCEMVVKSYGRNIEDIPEQHIDYNLCLLAVNSTFSSIEFIPEKFIDLQMACTYLDNLTISTHFFIGFRTAKGLIDVITFNFPEHVISHPEFIAKLLEKQYFSVVIKLLENLKISTVTLSNAILLVSEECKQILWDKFNEFS